MIIQKKKIRNSKLNLYPFPYFIVNDLIPKKRTKKIDKVLPNYKDITEKDIYFQSSSKTKKTLLPSSDRYKKLNKNKNFKKLNSLFKRLKPQIISKFRKAINENVEKNFNGQNYPIILLIL